MPQASSIETAYYGGTQDDWFDRTGVRELGFRGQGYVDCIYINRVAHGSETDGVPSTPPSITLGPHEYINSWEIYAQDGNRVFRAHFWTSDGHEIAVAQGSDSGELKPRITNARLLAIGGRAKGAVKGLEILYVKNYKPSIVRERNAQFILDIFAPGTEMEQYTEQSQQRVYAYSQVTKHQMEQDYSASVEGEYYAKVTASTEVKITDSTTTTINRSLQENLTQKNTIKQKVGDDSVGYSIVSATIMEHNEPLPDGTTETKYWMFPTGTGVQFERVKLTDLNAMRGKYDLTGVLNGQVSALGVPA